MIKGELIQLDKSLFAHLPFVFLPDCDLDAMAGAPAVILCHGVTLRREQKDRSVDLIVP